MRIWMGCYPFSYVSLVCWSVNVNKYSDAALSGLGCTLTTTVFIGISVIYVSSVAAKSIDYYIECVIVDDCVLFRFWTREISTLLYFTYATTATKINRKLAIAIPPMVSSLTVVAWATGIKSLKSLYKSWTALKSLGLGHGKPG